MLFGNVADGLKPRIVQPLRLAYYRVISIFYVILDTIEGDSK